MLPRLFSLVALATSLVVAQKPDSVRHVPGATVSGVVRDSIANVPLPGAMVQLVGADNQGRSVVADSLGGFTIPDVRDGTYMLGFFHPMLDSLGVESPPREITITAQRSLQIDLATPSIRSIRKAICGPTSNESSALVIGVVRNARDREPLAGATVIGEWIEMSFTRGGMKRNVPRLAATTGGNGWFAICNAPSAGMMALTAMRGADSTDVIDVLVPASGFVRRELYLGAARLVVTGDTSGKDSLAYVTRSHVGDSRLSGVVISSPSGEPLANAQVSVINGPATRANERGEWTLVNAPPGTRMLEVRATGYYPERRAVDVVANAPSIRTTLTTMRAMLDTVRIAGRRVGHDLTGFEERRRSGAGLYLTATDVMRRNPIEITDVLRLLPGLRIERSGMTLDTAEVDVDPNAMGTHLLMRGVMKDWCAPAIYMDGYYVGDLMVEDINTWTKPGEVVGIEIYRSPPIPPQFDRGMVGVGAGEGAGQVRLCGSIVVWTKQGKSF
jgi:hypothetical protein